MADPWLDDEFDTRHARKHLGAADGETTRDAARRVVSDLKRARDQRDAEAARVVAILAERDELAAAVDVLRGMLDDAAEVAETPHHAAVEAAEDARDAIAMAIPASSNEGAEALTLALSHVNTAVRLTQHAWKVDAS